MKVVLRTGGAEIFEPNIEELGQRFKPLRFKESSLGFAYNGIPLLDII